MSTKGNVVVHMLAKHRPDYLHYALILCRSLLNIGGMSKLDIFVTYEVALIKTQQDHDVLTALEYIGVQLFPRHASQISKFRCIDHLFKTDPTIIKVIQLDTDMVLTEPMDFIERMKDATKDCRIANYRQKGIDCVALFAERMHKLTEHPFKPLKEALNNFDVENSHRRLDLLIEASFGISPVERENALMQLEWSYGGVQVVSRAFINEPVWPAMLLMSTFSACDESVVLMWRAAEFLEWDVDPLHLIDEHDVALRINPASGFSMQYNSGLGLLHYSGDWYRRDNPANRAVIYQALSEALDIAS